MLGTACLAALKRFCSTQGCYSNGSKGRWEIKEKVRGRKYSWPWGLYCVFCVCVCVWVCLVCCGCAVVSVHVCVIPFLCPLLTGSSQQGWLLLGPPTSAAAPEVSCLGISGGQFLSRVCDSADFWRLQWLHFLWGRGFISLQSLQGIRERPPHNNLELGRRLAPTFSHSDIVSKGFFLACTCPKSLETRLVEPVVPPACPHKTEPPKVILTPRYKQVAVGFSLLPWNPGDPVFRFAWASPMQHLLPALTAQPPPWETLVSDHCVKSHYRFSRRSFIVSTQWPTAGTEAQLLSKCRPIFRALRAEAFPPTPSRTNSLQYSGT